MLVSKWRYGLVRTRCSKMCCKLAENFWRSGKCTKLLKIKTFLFHQVCHTGIVKIHVMFSEFLRKIATQNCNTVRTQKTCTPHTITKDTKKNVWLETWVCPNNSTHQVGHSIEGFTWDMVKYFPRLNKNANSRKNNRCSAWKNYIILSKLVNAFGHLWIQQRPEKDPLRNGSPIFFKW